MPRALFFARTLLPCLLGPCALAGLAFPAVAGAEVRRCALPNGQTLYTDRRCADLGAVERRAPAEFGGTAAASTRLYRGGCARNFQDLLYELTTAIDSRDVNRLAGLYHWPGMSASGALQVMRQLDAIVQRPLIDIMPILAAGPDGEDDGYYVQTTARRPPVALRLEQTLANGNTPSRTVFGLRRHMECWWVSL
jgi:hypothetical protein